MHKLNVSSCAYDTVQSMTTVTALEREQTTVAELRRRRLAELENASASAGGGDDVQ